MPAQRLQKLIAQAGLASRRAAEKLITGGRVAVDGQVVTELGTKADPDTQRITVDNKPLPSAERHEYWLLHKPTGVVCTADDPQGRPTVLDLMPPEAGARLYPVGRLDMYSEGLVLMTNHGELALRITHPRHHVEKAYKVYVEGHLSKEALDKLRSGVELEDGVTAPAKVFVKSSSQGLTKLNLVLREGRNRQVRRMCQAVGYAVKRLVRVGIGPLRLGEMPPGASRRLKPGEVRELLGAVGLTAACKPRGDSVNNSSRGRRTAAPQNKGR